MGLAIFLNCSFIVIGFMLMIPDAYLLWKAVRPESHYWKKLCNNNWKKWFISFFSLMLSWKLFMISLFVGMGRGISYAVVGVVITLTMWAMTKFEAPKIFFQDKPWKQI